MTKPQSDIGAHWRAIVDTVDDALLIIDHRGRIIAANPAAERLTGYAEAELKIHDCRVLNCTGCKIIAQGPREKWCRFFSVGSIRAKKCMITHKDGRIVHILKNANVLRSADGEIFGAVEILTDMSPIIRKEQEIKSLRRSLHMDDGFFGLVGKSDLIRNLFQLIEIAAQSDAPVIIQGESGTGKELVARALHDAGPRLDKPFVKVNCAALNENLLESELFGHIRGAFTGAEKNRVGRFEAAHEGSIFLDEIGDLPLSIQVKLLRVLEEKTIERVGDHQPIPVDVRIITATNKDLDDLVARGQFREDLFFRINVFPLYCPPLHQRIEDIPAIVRHFIRLNTETSGKRITGVTPEAMDALVNYSWPGNIRELRNAIEYAFVLCPGDSIGRDHLPHRLMSGSDAVGASGSGYSCNPRYRRLPDQTDEKRMLLDILRETGWNQSETARRMGISRVTVWKRMRKYGIRRD